MKRTSLISIVLLSLVFASTATEASAAGAKSLTQPSFSASPGISPAFGWKRHDYVVRCDSSPVRFSVKLSGNWKGRIDSLPRRHRSFTTKRRMKPGSRVVLRFTAPGGRHRKFSVRCLPSDFPKYTFRRQAKGGPRLFVMQFNQHYAAIINRDGAPVWWYQAEGVPDNAMLLPNGNIAYAPVADWTYQQGSYEIRTLRGRYLKTINTADDNPADVHEIVKLANGNFLTGSFTYRTGIDATAFGGAADASVSDAEIQEIRSDGSLAWSWDSGDHIGLEETGRWWDTILPQGQPYDVVHWNSVERNGNSLLMSFRHLDAVYKIDRATGDIIWKLGGTPTPESLEITNGPGGLPFGGQHDARLNKDGTISIFANNTDMSKQAAGIRYRVNEKLGTAKLVSSINDPKAKWSFCCGSYRVLPSGYSLVSWGGVPTLPGNPLATGATINGVIGAYDTKGRPVFRLKTPVGVSYRANPVEGPNPSLKKLRNTMDWMSENS